MKPEFNSIEFRKGLTQLKNQMEVCMLDIGQNKSMNRKIENAKYNFAVIVHNFGILIDMFNQHFPIEDKKADQ